MQGDNVPCIETDLRLEIELWAGSYRSRVRLQCDMPSERQDCETTLLRRIYRGCHELRNMRSVAGAIYGCCMYLLKRVSKLDSIRRR